MYKYTIDATIDYTSGPVTQSMKGYTLIVVNGAPYGNGWSPVDDNYLYLDSGNVYLVHGNGGYNYFQGLQEQYSTAPYGGLSYESGRLTGSGSDYTFTTSDGLQWNYTVADGQKLYLSSVVDPVGVTVTYAYDGSDDLTSVLDPNNTETVFTYSGSQLSTIQRGYVDGTGFHVFTDSTGLGTTATTAFTYGSGNLLTVTDPEGNVRTFTYDSNSKMLTDAEGSYQATSPPSMEQSAPSRSAAAFPPRPSFRSCCRATAHRPLPVPWL